MTKRSARAVANVILVSAGVAAAGAILASPPLRRLAGHAVRWWLGASIPVFLVAQAMEAWTQSSRTDLT
jgi:hypothetical protein